MDRIRILSNYTVQDYPIISMLTSLCFLHFSDPLFRSCQLLCCSTVTHDTNLYTFQLPAGTCMNIPIGYHVNVKMTSNGKIGLCFVSFPVYGRLNVQ